MGGRAMPTQIVMDYKGDTRHYFDLNDPESLAKAEKRFEELTGQGFTAAVRRGPGEVIKVSFFAPDAEETVFFPRLIGGEPRRRPCFYFVSRWPYGERVWWRFGSSGATILATTL